MSKARPNKGDQMTNQPKVSAILLIMEAFGPCQWAGYVPSRKASELPK